MNEEAPILPKEIRRPAVEPVVIPIERSGNPFATRKLLPEYFAIMHKRYGGQDSTEIVSEMRDRP